MADERSIPALAGERASTSREQAVLRVVGLYATIQILSYLVLQQACSPYVLGDVWIHGALGPLAAVKAIPRFQYHSVLSNLAFVLACASVFVAPFAYVARPGRATFAVSALGLLLWCAFGLGFSIDHM